MQRKVVKPRQPMSNSEQKQVVASRRQRSQLVESICVVSPTWDAIYEEMAYNHARIVDCSEPLGMLLFGLTGMGKSTLVKRYADGYSARRRGGVMKRPVVSAVVPARATTDDLASWLLRGMKDRRWNKGRLREKTKRIIDYLGSGETHTLILDELQHFVARGNFFVREEAADWLKNLMKEEGLHLFVVLVGLQNQAELLLRANDGQLGAFFGNPYVLHPLTWADKLESNEFLAFLAQVDDKLPFNEHPVGIVNEDVAWRCYVASRGVIRPLMRLVRRAAHIAIESDSPGITLNHLERAYDLALPGIMWKQPNPFIGDRPELSKDERRPRPQATPAGVNRRGGGGKQRTGMAPPAALRVNQVL